MRTVDLRGFMHSTELMNTEHNNLLVTVTDTICANNLFIVALFCCLVDGSFRPAVTFACMRVEVGILL